MTTFSHQSFQHQIELANRVSADEHLLRKRLISVIVLLACLASVVVIAVLAQGITLSGKDYGLELSIDKYAPSLVLA